MKIFVKNCVNVIFLLAIFISQCYPMSTKSAVKDCLESIIVDYISTLPFPESQREDISPGTAIVNFLIKFCPPDTALDGVDILIAKIDYLISQDKELKLYLPGFPFKSCNKTKCIGFEPDLGEFLALTTLEQIAQGIAFFHPKTSITIVSDGYAYKTLTDPSDDEIAMYHHLLQNLVEHFPHVIFQDGLSLGSERIKPEELRSAVAAQKQTAWTLENEETLKDMQIFMKRDCALLHLSDLQIKDLSLMTMIGSSQYAQFLKNYFPEEDYIRLSVHPHTNVSKKLGINIIWGQKGTPWHNAIVINRKKISLTNKIDYVDFDSPKPGTYDLCWWNGLSFLKPATLVMTRGGYVWAPCWD